MTTSSATQSQPTLVARLHLIGLKTGIAYCAASIVTIPFAGSIWLGELPLLALIQLPKSPSLVGCEST